MVRKKYLRWQHAARELVVGPHLLRINFKRFIMITNSQSRPVALGAEKTVGLVFSSIKMRKKTLCFFYKFTFFNQLKIFFGRRK